MHFARSDRLRGAAIPAVSRSTITGGDPVISTARAPRKASQVPTNAINPAVLLRRGIEFPKSYS